MLPDGRLIARHVSEDGTFRPWARVACVGQSIRIWQPITRLDDDGSAFASGVHRRTAQAFGDGTTRLLGRLSVGVIGCSGTGSWVIEMLARLGVATLVLVDPDRVEPHNLNRIVHATPRHAEGRVPKAEVLADAVRDMGLGTRVEALVADVMTASVVQRLAQCDVLVGCVDSLEARETLNRLAVYYSLPLVDVGVRLEADGQGGVQQIVGTVHYLHPESLGFLERGLYTPKQLHDVGLRRADPAAYATQVRQRYISGVNEERPAVASVNALYASLAVNELLSRLHEVRDDGTPLESITLSLSQLRILTQPEGERQSAYRRFIGRGDVHPLLGMPVIPGLES